VTIQGEIVVAELLARNGPSGWCSTMMPVRVWRSRILPDSRAQVSDPYGASESDATERLGYALYYVTNYSLGFDVTALLQGEVLELLES